MATNRITDHLHPASRPDPTPAEIAERAAAIRDSWDESTERQRRTGSSIEEIWTVPEVPARSQIAPEPADAYCGVAT